MKKDPPATIRVKKEKFRDLVSGVIGVSKIISMINFLVKVYRATWI